MCIQCTPSYAYVHKWVFIAILIPVFNVAHCISSPVEFSNQILVASHEPHFIIYKSREDSNRKQHAQIA